MSDDPELYVLARSVLLDVLEALSQHQEAVILVGAQAIYLRTGASEDLAVVPYTTDADLALAPDLLAQSPAIELLLTQAGLVPKADNLLGSWLARRNTAEHAEVEVEVDLMVPKAASPGSRRSANLKGHAKNAARVASGLEGALVDRDKMAITALSGADARSIEVFVAGPAAMIVAKVHKIKDRAGTERQSNKDALDVLRILQALDHDDIARRFKAIIAAPISGPVGAEGLELFKAQFGTAEAIGAVMAADAAAPLVDPDEIKQSCAVLAASLLRAIGS